MSKLLVPVDFSPTSAVALRYATYLGDVTGLTLSVLHVHDGFAAEETHRLLEVKGNVPAQVAAQRKLAGFVRRQVSALSFTGVRDQQDRLPLVEQFAVVSASPATAILTQADQASVRLIVMGGVGSSRSSTAEPHRFGSVARAIALRARVPVLLIPNGYGTPSVTRIAFAFEDPETLRNVRQTTAFLARALRVQDVRYVRQPSAVPPPLPAATPATHPGTDTLPAGDLPDVLAEYVLEADVDLLIVGRRRGGSLFERLFLPSRVRPLLRRCPVPLLIVPLTGETNY